jgi:protein TonB
MTGPAGMSMLRRPFGLPVALSLALHGLAVAALGTFPLSTNVTPAQNDGIKVDLVTIQRAPVVRPKPVRPTPEVKRASVTKVRPAAVKRTSPRSTAVVVSRVRLVTTPMALPVTAPFPMAPTEPVSAVSEAPPSFMDLPRTLAPAAAPASVFARAATFVVPEGMEPVVAFTASAGEVSFSRPLPGVSSGHARLLRDSTPEAGSVRSKVRSGNNPRPDYPRAAREAGWEGTVVLQVLVLPDGTAGNVTLHKTSGHSILDEAALNAVKGWQFIPAMDGNFAVKSMVRMPVRFDLKAAN